MICLYLNKIYKGVINNKEMKLDRFIDLCIEEEGEALSSIGHRDLGAVYDEIRDSFSDLNDQQAVSIYRVYKIGLQREHEFVRK